MGCGCCRSRNILMFILVLQMLLVVERQVFDFLGFMWAPIIANFLQIAFLVVGIFGLYQYRPGYVITYAVWSLLWFGICLTIIAIYLEIGELSYQDDWLSLKTNHYSWWTKNGIGCSGNSTAVATTSTVPPPGEGPCLLSFQYVESIQCGVECILAFTGFWLACWVARTFGEEDDQFDFIGGFDMYSAYQPPTKSSRMQMQPISS